MREKLTQHPDPAKEKAVVRATASGVPASVAAHAAKRAKDFPEFAWLGAALAEVEPWDLIAASALVRAGVDPRGPEVGAALKRDLAAAAFEAEVASVQQRARRPSGGRPDGKSLEERRAYVSVRIALKAWARISKRPVGRREAPGEESQAEALLADVGLQAETARVELLELHPRAKRRELERYDAATDAQLAAELDALERGVARDPDESSTRLPDRICSATRRNHRRRNEARSQYDAEQRHYKRMAKLERLSNRTGGRMKNPAGVKPLPLHEGRKAREIAWDWNATRRFLATLSGPIRARLFAAATKGNKRGRRSESSMLLIAFYAYLVFQSETPRPSMRRSGYARAVEGLTREALAAAFPWNRATRRPFCANTMSNMTDALVRAGLVLAEMPNGQPDAYTGVTGWALSVYRVRSAEELLEVLRAHGIPVPVQLELRSAPAAEAPS